MSLPRDICEVIPSHPKNWLTDFEVYVIVLLPEIKVPDCSNPIVESTEITELPEGTSSRTFVFPGILKVPSIKSLSLYPTNNSSL